MRGLTSGVAVFLAAGLVSGGDEPSKPMSKFPLGKETTFVTGPLTKDGYIDYEAALNDRLARGVTPEKNANVLLWQALGPTPEGYRMPAEFFKRLGMEEPSKDGSYYLGLRVFLKERVKLDPSEFEAIYAQQQQALRRPWGAKEFPHLAAFLKVNEHPLEMVVAATRRPAYYNPLLARRTGKEPPALMNALLPGVQMCRALAGDLARRAMLRTSEGKFDEAWQDLLACHRLGQLVARGGTLIESLIGVAIVQIAASADLAYLEHATLTTAQRLARLQDLQGLPPLPAFATKIDLGERLMFLDSLQLVRRGGFEMLDGLSSGRPSKPDPEEEKALALIDWEPALRLGNDWFNRFYLAARLPDRKEQRQQFAAFDKELAALAKDSRLPRNPLQLLLGQEPPSKTVGKGIGAIMVGMMLPAIGKVRHAHDRAEQWHRNVQLAFALAAFRGERGTYPAKLDELSPKYLKTIPDDLFSGAALVYRPAGQGYLLYSVGPNGKDEEGRDQNAQPSGDDLSVRLPMPVLNETP